MGLRRRTSGRLLERIRKGCCTYGRTTKAGKLNLSKQENSLVGADLAAVASNFAQAQLENQATLSATARVLGLPTLLDFLK